MRIIRPAALLGVLALAACSTTGDSGGDPSVGEPSGAPWQCDADGARSLIGSHRGAVTFAQNANVRFVCTQCAMTHDFRPDRLTVLYNRDTGIIEDVRCV